MQEAYNCQFPQSMDALLTVACMVGEQGVGIGYLELLCRETGVWMSMLCLLVLPHSMLTASHYEHLNASSQ